MIKFTDMKSIERQKERLNELLKLCAENPDLPDCRIPDREGAMLAV